MITKGKYHSNGDIFRLLLPASVRTPNKPRHAWCRSLPPGTTYIGVNVASRSPGHYGLATNRETGSCSALAAAQIALSVSGPLTGARAPPVAPSSSDQRPAQRPRLTIALGDRRRRRGDQRLPDR